MVMVLEPQSKAAGWRAVVVGMAIVGAWLTIGAGLVVAGSAAAGQGSAQVPVRVSEAAPLAYMDVVLPCVQGWSLDGSGCEPAAPAAQWQGGTPLPVRHSGGLETATDGTGPVASVLAMAPRWVGLVGGGLVVLLLLPVVRSTASGRLFEQAIARRLALAAGTVLAAWILASAGPALAAPSFIERMEQTPVYGAPPDGFPMPHGWLIYDPDITWWPLLIVALLGILATATRSGARLATDSAGLV